MGCEKTKTGLREPIPHAGPFGQRPRHQCAGGRARTPCRAPGTFGVSIRYRPTPYAVRALSHMTLTVALIPPRRCAWPRVSGFSAARLNCRPSLPIGRREEEAIVLFCLHQSCGGLGTVLWGSFPLKNYKRTAVIGALWEKTFRSHDGFPGVGPPGGLRGSTGADHSATRAALPPPRPRPDTSSACSPRSHLAYLLYIEGSAAAGVSAGAAPR